MGFPPNQRDKIPRPPRSWGLIAAVGVALVLCLLLFLLVLGSTTALGQRIFRGLSRWPLIGSVVRPLVQGTPGVQGAGPTTPGAQETNPTVQSLRAAPTLFPTATPGAHPYLVRPSNWPADWPWPPRTDAVRAAPGAAAPGPTATISLLVKPTNWPTDRPWPPKQ